MVMVKKKSNFGKIINCLSFTGISMKREALQMIKVNSRNKFCQTRKQQVIRRGSANLKKKNILNSVKFKIFLKNLHICSPDYCNSLVSKFRFFIPFKMKNIPGIHPFSPEKQLPKISVN